jgi:hypothetical protein
MTAIICMLLGLVTMSQYIHGWLLGLAVALYGIAGFLIERSFRDSDRG